MVAAMLVRVTELAVAGGMVITTGGIGNGALVVVAIGLALTLVGSGYWPADRPASAKWAWSGVPPSRDNG